MLKCCNFFQLVLSSLESLYNLSGVGQVTSDHIAEVNHSIGKYNANLKSVFPSYLCLTSQ